MRCSNCTERNSVAARKCEFCGEKFKRRALPLGFKLAVGGVAVALTASIAASLMVPKLVDPEQKLARVAKRVAAGPKSPEDANKEKRDFSNAVRDYLRLNGSAKSNDLSNGLQKLLPSSAYEVHVAELPRGMRVIEIDTVLQATDFLLMKTSSGLKVFDLPGYEIFDDAKVLKDSAGPVLALIGHTGGPPPHRPQVRVYALLPDYISDETEKLVPSLAGDGEARFIANGQDVQIELAQSSKNAAGKIVRGPTNFGLLHWKDARYVADFSPKAAGVARAHGNDAIATAPPKTETRTDNGAHGKSSLLDGSKSGKLLAAASPALANVINKASSRGKTAKIVVRGLTDQHPVQEANPGVAESGAALAAVPVAPSMVPLKPTSPLMSTMPGLQPAAHGHKAKHGQSTTAPLAPVATTASATQSSKHAKSKSNSNSTVAHAIGSVRVSGATLRSKPERGAASMGALPRSTQVVIIGKTNDWYHVRSGGQEGWVHSSLIEQGKQGKVQTTPVAAAPETSEKSGSRHHHKGRHNSANAVAMVSEHHADTSTEKRSPAKTAHSKKTQEAPVEAPTLVP